MNRSNYTFLRWIKSIMFVVACILALCGLLCGYMLWTLRDTTLQMSRELTGYMQSTLDSRLSEIQKYSSFLELHPANTYLKKLTQTPPSTTSEVYQFSDQMLNYRSTSRLVEGISIYYPAIGQIVGDLGCYKDNSYYALDNMLILDGWDKWLQTLSSQSGNEFVYMDIDGTGRFCYVRKMIYDSKVVGCIVIRLNTEELLNSGIAGGPADAEHSSFGILINGRLFCHTGNGALLSSLLEEMDTLPDEPSEFSTSNSMLYIQPSSFSNLCYVNAYYHKKNLQPIYTAFALCIAGFAACIVIAFVLSVHISRKNIRPLMALINKLDAGAAGGDEYQKISSSIDQLLLEKYESEGRMQDQQSLIGSLFLKTVLCGDMHNEYSIFNVAKRCDVIFENPCYLVGLISPETPQFFNEELIAKLNRYCEQEGYFVISSVYENNIVVLFNLDESVSQKEAADVLERVGKELLADAGVRICVGQSLDGLMNITSSYTQAITALHSSALGGAADSGSPVCYTLRMESLPFPDLSHISLFENFSQACFSGDFSEGLALAPALFEHYFSEADSPEVHRIKFRAVQNLLLNLKQKARASAPALEHPVHTSQLLSCASLDLLREQALSLLQMLAAPQKEEGGSAASLAERAKAFIDKSFSDPMLGLYMIAAELHVSNSYLSTTFKNTFGTGVVQYINSLRIEQAKKLICTTDLSIRDIALAVGFSSDASFIRVFKRYEMQTPSTLRKGLK